MGLLEAQRPVVEAMLKAFTDIEVGKDKEKILNDFLADAFEGFAQNLRRLIN